MWNLYLDESGDLGFDFVNKKPSKFFTIKKSPCGEVCPVSLLCLDYSQPMDGNI